MSASDQASVQLPFLVVFAAQGIQTYILRSDKLREIVGASELVESMANELLDETLRQVGVADPGDVVLSRAAGSARILFPTERQACQFALIWPLLVAQHAPGLAVSLIVMPSPEGPIAAITAADQLMRCRRSYPMTDLPEAGPFTARHPRSGRPLADNWEGEEESAVRGTGPVDHETGRKRESAKSGHHRLIDKMLGSEADASLKTALEGAWPLDVAKIADESHGLAIFHADGNRLGETVIGLLKDLAAKSIGEAILAYRTFCEGVESATLKALRTALDGVMQRTLEARRRGSPDATVPFRPLVCAGDDVTVILRDMDAMPFARAFLKEFERMVQHDLKAHGLGDFTACGALVYIRSKFPFADAYTLCESMCAATKQAVGRRRSALSFVRVASSLPGDYGEFVERERTREGDRGRLLTMNPYLVGPAADGHPSLIDLCDLNRLLGTLPRGALREAVAAAYGSITAADIGFARFLQMLESVDQRKNTTNKAAFLDAFGKLTGQQAGALWQPGSPKRTPLYDVLELKAVSAPPSQ